MNYKEKIKEGIGIKREIEAPLMAEIARLKEERDAALRREEKLRAALTASRPYLLHNPDCGMLRFSFTGNGETLCDCGLSGVVGMIDAALAAGREEGRE